MGRTVAGLIGIVVAGLLAAGCSSGSEQGTPTATTDPGPIELPEAPVMFSPFATVASGSWLVTVLYEPYLPDEPSDVVVVNLDSGESVAFDGPADATSTVALYELVSDGDGFIGVGDRCLPGGPDQGCSGPMVVVRLDPSSQEWEVEDIEPEQTGQFEDVFLVDDDVVLVQSVQDGVRVSTRDSSGTWSAVAEWSLEPRPTSCVAGQTLWVFSQDDAGDVAPSYTLTSVDLSTGTVADVDLPANDFREVHQSFGCDRSGPILASTSPDRDTEPSPEREVFLWRFVGQGWEIVPVEALNGPALTDEIISGDQALVLATKYGGPPRPVAVVLGTDGPTEVERDTADRFVWRGDTGQLVRIYNEGNQRYVTTLEVAS